MDNDSFTVEWQQQQKQQQKQQQQRLGSGVLVS
jgi:hypothetical protein